jgi:hypothetical protein
MVVPWILILSVFFISPTDALYIYYININIYIKIYTSVIFNFNVVYNASVGEIKKLWQNAVYLMTVYSAIQIIRFS